MPEPDRIAVMMSFAAEFAPVWMTLKAAAQDGGSVCQRADDIWEDTVLVNDVVALIARSKVVICDLTGRNANVFYEAGIAHTLGREVVLIAQSGRRPSVRPETSPLHPVSEQLRRSLRSQAVAYRPPAHHK